MPVYRLSQKQAMFPSPYEAEPDGLLAIGGSLTEDFLLAAYSQGIFPWYAEGQPILWWSPAPRCVILPENFHIPKSIKKLLPQNIFEITLDKDFEAVINACAQPRSYSKETWLLPEMRKAYLRLHHMGLAHSVEAWQNGCLVGGAYGIALGKVFCGESMFYHTPNASKVSFVFLAERLWQAGFEMIDCQQETKHMLRFGAVTISRKEFMNRLALGLAKPSHTGSWQKGIL